MHPFNYPPSLLSKHKSIKHQPHVSSLWLCKIRVMQSGCIIHILGHHRLVEYFSLLEFGHSFVICGRWHLLQLLGAHGNKGGISSSMAIPSLRKHIYDANNNRIVFWMVAREKLKEIDALSILVNC